MERYKLYDEALEVFGQDAQIDVAIEEMAELIQALIHIKRKNRTITYNEIAGEIADVEIMLEQLTNMFPCRDLVEDKKLYKLDKLKGYLEDKKKGDIK